MLEEILTINQRSKEDNNNDELFYSQPRYVHHLDQPFRDRLTNLYREKIPKESIVLDLMSSWVSHLPKEVRYKRIIGHGLNLQELEKNERLDSYWIQNLNTTKTLPLEDNSIDVCLMVAAWQYLQYPEAIALELRRILKTNGQLIVSFSNRAFWSKSPRIWIESSDLGRLKYISSILISQGWDEPDHISEDTYKKAPFGFLRTYGDPFFSVIARA